jgi:excisionase family DNA binding protein
MAHAESVHFFLSPPFFLAAKRKKEEKKMKDNKKRPVMSVAEVSKRLGLSYLTTLRMARAGELPTMRLGGRKYLILREPFEALLRKPQGGRVVNE